MKTPTKLAPGHWCDLAAPAKVNTFLHVVGQRSDGMHLLQSVFMLLDWGDYLDIEVTPHSSGITRIDRPTGLANKTLATSALPANDLCVKAATLLQRACATQQGARIGLQKNLPSEAGLGGGSSDAATCLLALNKLWATNLSTEQLCELAVQLGADVPFFVRGHNAFVEGIGERITPIDLPATWLWLLKPSVGAATPAIFKSPLLTRNTPRIEQQALADLTPSELWAFGHNDLQAVAEQLCPDISRASLWLQARGLQPKMSGSGSTVFAHFSPKASTSDAPYALDVAGLPAGWLSHKCKNLEKHPLLDWKPPKNVR